MFIFFFKQKPAYDMRISDWSSDVCSSDLDVSGTISGEERIPEPTEVVSVLAIQRGTADPDRYVIMSGDIDSRVSDVMDFTSDSPGANDNASGVAGTLEAARILSQHSFPGTIVYAALSGEEQGLRSEEHTSELQSLMRISYAVFCLKKNNNQY